MRKTVLAIFLALIASAALANGNYAAGGKVLSPGDSAMRVLDAMGEPKMKEPVQNRLGAQMGEYWYYKDGNKTIRFFISGGKIIEIEEIR